MTDGPEGGRAVSDRTHYYGDGHNHGVNVPAPRREGKAETDDSLYTPKVATTAENRERARRLIYPGTGYTDEWAPGFVHERIEDAAAEMDRHDNLVRAETLEEAALIAESEMARHGYSVKSDIAAAIRKAAEQ